MYYIVLLYKDRLYRMPTDLSGNFTIGAGKKDNLVVDDLKDIQIIMNGKKGKISLKTKGDVSFSNDNVQLNTMIILDESRHLIVHISEKRDDAGKTLKLPYQCMVKVGRSDKNDIVIKSPYVSGSHCTLKNESGILHVEDNNSTNGLYLNGKRISKAKMRAGDVLSILNMNIRLGNAELFFENMGGILTVKEIEEDSAFGGTAKDTEGEKGSLKYRRSPRTQEQLPTESIVLASAPSQGAKYEKRKGMFSSLVGTGVMFAANMATGVASPALLAARAASLVSPITSIASQAGGEKERKKKGADYAQLRMEKYGQYIAEQKAKIESVATVQRDIITRENPPAKECLVQLEKLNRSLWERGTTDRDFLDVRLGMGYEKLCVDVKSRDEGNFRMEDDEVRELAEQIVEETRIVDNVPARLSLKEYKTISVIGNRHKVTDLVKNMLVSFTTAHCFEEVRIVGIFDEEEKQVWESLRWLPHVWDENRQFRYLAFDEENAHQLCEVMQDMLVQRNRAEEKGYSKEMPLPIPYYIFVLGSRKYTEKEEIMNFLTSNNPMLGVTTLFLFNDLYSLPHSCQFIVDVDNGPCGYVRNEVNNKFFFSLDQAVTGEEFDRFARRMSAIELEGFATQAEIPQGVTFLQGFGVSRVDQLDVLSKWKESVPYGSLAAPIGIMAGEKTFALDIDWEAHGPHGLVAGTTGSGKSETLMSWILSMCVCYHPHDVNFVIIDYKGGGMANQLEKLPHVVGKITNIGSNINRSLVSLKSEMKRRQEIFAQYEGASDIKKYQKLYRKGVAKEIVPHLIIVADEFAELKKEEPDFMKELVTAARIGRSLGIKLVLATQKPSGVVDEQIQSNSNFRICLKVQSGADSREMIGRPDAARLTQSGRAYVRVGEDIIFTQFQSFWSGAPYTGGATQERNVGNSVRLVETNGARLKTVEKEMTRFKSDMDELTAIRDYLCNVCEQNGIEKLDGPWLPELPENLSVKDFGIHGGFDGTEWRESLPWLKVPIGMYDAPEQQKQGIQYIDFLSEGHYGIYGAPSTGKTTLLKTIVWSLSVFYSPADVNIYIIDCGGWSMNVFSSMPHVGGVALDCEEEKILKLQAMLAAEMNERKKKFLNYGVNSLAAYRQATQGGMPAIILAIDNIVPLFDMFPDIENLMITLARDGATYGIYMVYTANNTTGVRYKVVQNIRGAVAFELTDRGDYTGIVGRLDGMTLPKIPGRCFFKGNPPIEFQAAVCMDADTEMERAEKIKQECVHMDEMWDGMRPDAIPVMPEELKFDELFQGHFSRGAVPMGISYETIRPAIYDMNEKYVLLLSGTMNSGKSAYLNGLLREMKKKRPEDKYYVFDGHKGGMREASSLCDHYAAANQAEEVSAMLAEIVEALNVRKRAQNQARSMAGDTFSEQEFISEYEQICIFIDDLKDFIDEVDNECKNSMERICRLAQGLGVSVFVAGRVSDLERYNEIESLTRAIVSYQSAIGLGGNAAIHTFLNNDLSYKDKEQDAGDGNGYLFMDGHCTRIKIPG